MKRKYVIYSEAGVDESGRPIRNMVKTFKNEPEAMAFYGDIRNARRYGAMFMYKSAGDSAMLWDDRREEWVFE